MSMKRCHCGKTAEEHENHEFRDIEFDGICEEQGIFCCTCDMESLIVEYPTFNDSYRIICINCTRERSARTIKDAIVAWNTRPKHWAEKELAEALSEVSTLKECLRIAAEIDAETIEPLKGRISELEERTRWRKYPEEKPAVLPGNRTTELFITIGDDGINFARYDKQSNSWIAPTNQKFVFDCVDVKLYCQISPLPEPPENT